MLKKNLFILSAATVAAIGVHAMASSITRNQTISTKTIDTGSAEKLMQVRLAVGKINNNLAAYTKVVKENVEDESLEGNEIHSYFEKNKIKKMAGTFYGETYRLLEEYYFDDDKLIFFYSKREEYKVPLGVDANVKVAATKESRYYFKNGKIFLAKLKPVSQLSPAELLKLSDETRKEADRLLKSK